MSVIRKTHSKKSEARNNMGDMADFVLEGIMREEELYLQALAEGWSLTEMYEEGLVDELGYSHYEPLFSRPKNRGPGSCPICGSKTKLKEGKHGKFYGCENRKCWGKNKK